MSSHFLPVLNLLELLVCRSHIMKASKNTANATLFTYWHLIPAAVLYWFQSIVQAANRVEK